MMIGMEIWSYMSFRYTSGLEDSGEPLDSRKGCLLALSKAGWSRVDKWKGVWKLIWGSGHLPMIYPYQVKVKVRLREGADYTP